MSQLSGGRSQAQGMTAQELPLRRYFQFVGGGLLALLCIRQFHLAEHQHFETNR